MFRVLQLFSADNAFRCISISWRVISNFLKLLCTDFILFQLFKISEHCQNCQTCQNGKKLWKFQNCQNCQKCQNCQNFQDCEKWRKNCQECEIAKDVKIVKSAEIVNTWTLQRFHQAHLLYTNFCWYLYQKWVRSQNVAFALDQIELFDLMTNHKSKWDSLPNHCRCNARCTWTSNKHLCQ